VADWFVEPGSGLARGLRAKIFPLGFQKRSKMVFKGLFGQKMAKKNWEPGGTLVQRFDFFIRVEGQKVFLRLV
jgi:hypothetical protein